MTAPHSAQELAQALGKARKSGQQWKCLCPVHNDHDPSLWVRDGDNGTLLVTCRSGCSQEAVIDALRRRGLWPEPENKAEEDTAKQSASRRASELRQPASPKAGEETWRPIVPPPSDAPAPAARQLRCDTLHEYRAGTDDHLLVYVRRHEATGTRRKQFIPLTYGRLTDEHGKTTLGWHDKAPDAPRPLYGLNRLAHVDHPAATVILCEGEKAADAAQRMFPDMVALSWFGGVGAVEKGDYAALKGRDVILWGDADEPGAKAIDWLAAHVFPAARIVDTSGLPKGFDAADLEGDTGSKEWATWLQARIRAAATPEPPDIDTSILRLNRRAPPTFPLAVFGANWMGWIKHAAEAACCPVDYVAAPLLATASALIGNARWAQAWHGWEEPPNLWLASVGDSGDGKSPGTVALFRHALPELERRMIGDYPDRLREWETNAEVAKQRQADWQQEVAKASKKSDARKAPIPPRPADADPGPAPQEPRLKLHDVTIEKVGMLLAAAAPKGLLMVRDELAGFLLGMNVYNDSARSFWLEAWNGNAYRVDRMKNAEPIKIPRLAVSWFGTVQPERLAELMEEPDDGLLARFLYCWPDPIPFNRSHAAHDLEFAVRALDRLRLLDMHRNSEGTPAPILMPLQSAALPRLIAFANDMQHRRDLAAGLLRSSYGKARGVALRMALVLQLLWWCGADGYEPPPTVISDAALEAATVWVGDYAIPMAERTFGDAACSQSDRNITTLARWIAQERPGEVHVRTMERQVRLAGLTTVDAIHATCKALIDAGWLLPRPPSTSPQGGRPREAYPVNAALWEVLK